MRIKVKIMKRKLRIPEEEEGEKKFQKKSRKLR